MTIIIKKVGNTRSCQLLNNKPMAKNNLVEDLLSALKGMKIKLEVKIVDANIDKQEISLTISPTTEQEETSPSRSSTGQQQTEEHADSAPKSNQVPVKADPSPNIRDNILPGKSNSFARQPVVPQRLIEEVRPQISPVQENKASRTEVPQESRAPVPTPSRPRDEPVRVTPIARADVGLSKTPVEKCNPLFASDRPRLGLPPATAAPIKPPSKPTLVKGSLVVGALMDTCCVSVDQDEKPPMAYILYSSSKAVQLSDKITELTDGIERQSIPTNIRIGDMVLAKSNEDDIWYRSVVETIDNDLVGVFFFDWGLREQLDVKRVRFLTHPELSIKDNPACVVRLRIVDTPVDATADFFKGESCYTLKIKSYDDFADHYEAAIVGRTQPKSE